MTINFRAKGAGGESEIAKHLEVIIRKVMLLMGIPAPTVSIVQRNQNQSAVGGSDLTNTFGTSIEVKRQENLNVNTWWTQCTEAAKQNNEIPVLLYRQNNKKWRCVTWGWLNVVPPNPNVVSNRCRVRVEVSWDEFLAWFELLVRAQLEAGYRPRV